MMPRKPVALTEEQRTVADRNYWMQLFDVLPWQIYGWRYRDSASFFTRKDAHGKWALPILEIRGHEFDQIITAVREAKARGGR